jgi:hypothetical protein
MNITLHDTITVNDANGKPTELNITGWSPEFIAYGLAYFHGVKMQRCTASVDEDKHLEARQAMFESMAKGEMPHGGRGGGLKLSDEVAGRIAYYNRKGSECRIKGQIANGKNIDAYDVIFVRKAIWDDLREMMKEMTEPEQREFVRDEIPQIVKDSTESVLDDAMKDIRPGFMGDFVESEKRKRSGLVAPTFKAKAVIKRK